MARSIGYVTYCAGEVNGLAVARFTQSSTVASEIPQSRATCANGTSRRRATATTSSRNCFG